MSEKSEKSKDLKFSKLNKAGNIINIVRERYLRDDISCASLGCKMCKNEGQVKLILQGIGKGQDAKIQYIIPTGPVLKKYFEIFRHLKNLIVCESNTNWVDSKKIRKYIVEDNRGILFPNEHFAKTFHEGNENDSHQTLIDQVALWYHHHLMGKVQIVVMSEEVHPNDGPCTWMTMKEYSAEYLKGNKELLELITQIESQKESFSDEKYHDHYSIDYCEAQVAKKVMYKGKLKMNTQSWKEGQIKNSIDNETIFISGRKDLNRAIHGDVVYVEVISRDEKVRGRVVGIFKSNWRDYVACISNDKETSSDSFLCFPLDKRIPRIRIRTKQGSSLANSRILVRIQSWDVDSKYPSGFYVQNLGLIGDLNVETEALMVEHQIPHEKFSEDAMKMVPSELKISAKGRLDLRRELILSVDPIGCEDIDDALSYKILENGNIQVGVHIADVSLFVPEDSALDLEARKRATSVYLIDRRLDMLPVSLATRICSLHMGEDRYAVSVLWEFDSDFNIVKTTFGRSMIHSAYSLHYEQAHDIMQGRESPAVHLKTRNWKSCTVLKEDWNAVQSSLLGLTKIARMLRKRRDLDGALELQSLDEVQITVDPENKPVKLEVHEDIEIHHTIAEWMITANQCVAERIYEHFPDCTLLRRHPLPNAQSFENLVATAKSLGFEINTESNAKLAHSLELAQNRDDPNVNLLLKSLATRAMSEAIYVSSGSVKRDEYYHYGLALKFYTHFTSPIRRYADILVHRQLLACETRKITMENQQIHGIADYINERHRASKYIQGESSEWFSALFLKESGPLLVDAILYQIRDHQLFFFVPKYYLKSSLFLKEKNGNIILPRDLKGKPWQMVTVDTSKTRVTINYGNSSYILSLFDHFQIYISCAEFREHRPSITFELYSFKKSTIILEDKKSLSRQYIQKRIEISNQIAKNESDGPIRIEQTDTQTISKVNLRDSAQEKITSELSKIDLNDIQYDLEEKELKKQLDIVEKKLLMIEKLKMSLIDGVVLTLEEQERLSTEERYQKNLIKVQNKLKILKAKRNNETQ